MSSLAICLLLVLLLIPGHPDQFTLSRLQELPLDVPLIVLLLLLLNRTLSTMVRLLVTGAVLCLLLLRLGDLISRAAFGRAFNPLAEWHLIQQGWTLTSDTIGKAEAIALTGLGIGILLTLAVLLYRGLGYLDQLNRQWRRSWLLLCCIPLLSAMATAGGPGRHVLSLDTQWVLAGELIDRIQYTQWAVRDQARFSEALQVDELEGREPAFAALSGRDVIIIYVESYGRSFVDNPQFREQARHRLQAVQNETVSAGLHVRSAWVDSPIRGGRSWLAHSTVASGLRLTNHARFDRLISSDRKSLPRLFKQAGWTTSVVLPVVKSHWVEGAWYQVDRFFDHAALDYQGEGFGFVTMPDQYTLTAFERQVRATADAPLMAHIGLLDSHAPWGPLPRHQAWEDIEDGSLFDGTQRYGERHSWARAEPVRKAYGTAVEQNLKLVGEYLARYADDALVIVLGDHQPASVIAGWAPNAHVPMHVFSADEALLERLPDDMFSHGMLPAEQATALPMESIRGLLGTVFEATPSHWQPLTGSDSTT
ncbi:sulfatase-like hydrolase/transferase [Granulosicoccus sp. 3-233]|uniref:sulfatase-like hydrolase/transferase n=1 Tax=Granulosicoccus sp. 3-233 TaxID=3417969 RepID=UPI003D35261D